MLQSWLILKCLQAADINRSGSTDKRSMSNQHRLTQILTLKLTLNQIFWIIEVIGAYIFSPQQINVCTTHTEPEPCSLTQFLLVCTIQMHVWALDPAPNTLIQSDHSLVHFYISVPWAEQKSTLQTHKIMFLNQKSITQFKTASFKFPSLQQNIIWKG